MTDPAINQIRKAQSEIERLKADLQSARAEIEKLKQELNGEVLPKKLSDELFKRVQLKMELDSERSRSAALVKAIDKMVHELGVPQPGYAMPVANAYAFGMEAIAAHRKGD